jgi:DnaK suppressor protein
MSGKKTGKRTRALPKKKVTELRKRLETERDQLTEQAERLEADFLDESWKETRSEDDAFAGTATFERERTMSLARNSRAVLAQIEAALDRIEEGTYGRCIRCEEHIPADRLEAIPQAPYCMECQRTEERSAR